MRYFLKENGKIIELIEDNENKVDLSFYKKDYIVELSDDIVLIDTEIKKLRPYIKYLLNSKSEDLKDMFVLFILIISVVTLILTFLSFQNFNNFSSQFVKQTNMVSEKVKNIKNIPKDFNNQKEIKEEIKNIEIDEKKK